MTRRCPLHPDGCVKHPNLTPPAPVSGNPAKRPGADRWQRRGSLETLIAVYHKRGRGNPAKRRRIVRRSRS